MQRLNANEEELIGDWVQVDGEMLVDAVTRRIQDLTLHYLIKIGTADGGWSTLYRDPADGRYWEYTYPRGEMHGGGPPSPTHVSHTVAAQKYGIA